MNMSMDAVCRQAFAFYLKWEGSRYTDDPRDPGGPTKYGVALNYNRDTIPDKDGDGDVDADDVRLLDKDDALRIWQTSYWGVGKCADMPAPLAFMAADMTVNPGPGAAARCLQRAINRASDGRLDIAVDGRIGPVTLEAVQRVELRRLLWELAAQRAVYYGTRQGFSYYGEGWSRRTTDCLFQALCLTEAAL